MSHGWHSICDSCSSVDLYSQPMLKEIEVMLVLSRKDGESIRIGDDILVRISEIRGGRVKIAIDAPRDVRVRRSELRRVKESTSPRQNQQLELVG